MKQVCSLLFSLGYRDSQLIVEKSVKKNKANMGKDNEQAIHETTQIASIQMKLKSSI